MGDIQQLLQALSQNGYKITRIRHRKNVYRYYYEDEKGVIKKLADVPESRSDLFEQEE